MSSLNQNYVMAFTMQFLISIVHPLPLKPKLRLDEEEERGAELIIPLSPNQTNQN
jgi:hypothetical protein